MGVEFIKANFKGVQKEFVPYLSQQDMLESVYTNQVVDDFNNDRKAIRSMIVYQTRRLAENGEECFVVTATNPNILGSDKGVAYCRILFQGIQRAFSRHVEQIKKKAHQTAERHHGIEQGPETSTGHSLHSELQTYLKMEIPSRKDSENGHRKINPNSKQERYLKPRQDENPAQPRNISTSQGNDRGKQPLKDKNEPPNMFVKEMSYFDDSSSDILGFGTDEDSINDDILLSDSELLPEPLELESTGSKRTHQTIEGNSEIKKFKATTQSSTEGKFRHTKNILPELNNNLITDCPSTSGLQSIKHVNKEGNRFVCVVKGCEKSHSSRIKQLEHYISHSEKKLYACDICHIPIKNRSSVDHHRKRNHPDIEYKPQGILRNRLEELEKELESKNDVSTSYNTDDTSKENMPKQRNSFCGIYLPEFYDDQDFVQ
ncbi:uncharacterized protein LOC128211768 isoform X2 [Mya arenaria]|nr:uncharacterized protein LOC128211768 isoform X2 [Mya arenaria]XP_052772774.1 uncharacterized protein LOC128211768 isoform X2 [Mya arenaria]XP_052772775.1 uncharacterized protein LOC128211768 isoform X2 [Mya arenaria]